MGIDVIGTIQDRQEPFLGARHLIEKVIAEWLEESADRLGEDVTPAPVNPTGVERCRPPRFRGTTVRGYADKIAYFIEWWEGTGPSCNWNLTRKNLRQFERWLRHRPSRYGKTLSYHTRKDALRRLHQALVWAEIEGIIQNVTPSRWVPTPDGNPPEYIVPHGSELIRLIEAARSGPNPVRDMAILATLIGTGMRRSECAKLNVENVDLLDDHSGEIAIRNPKPTKGSGDRPRVRRVAIDSHSGQYLRRWIDGIQYLEGPLWRSRMTGRHLTPRSLARIVRQCWDRAGLVANQPAHDLRRVYVSEWRRLHGNSLDKELGMQVGHGASRMSDLYDRRQVDAVLAVAQSPMLPATKEEEGILVADWPRGGFATA